jgi:hypothetical protein
MIKQSQHASWERPAVQTGKNRPSPRNTFDIRLGADSTAAIEA